MMLDRDIEDTRQPEEGLYHATCEWCGDVKDCGDMTCVGGDTFVCDGECLEKYIEWESDQRSNQVTL
jgi:hypothetical protein